MSGAFYYKAINSIIIDLKKADSILHSDSIKELIKALSYAQKIEKSLFFLKNKKKLIRKLKEDFRSLEINKSLAIPISASQHAMILLITCIGKNENGKKIYQATHYNTGLGIKNHHYSQYNDQQLIFQTGLEITAITEEKLCGKNSSFFNDLFQLHNSSSEKNITTLYQKILPQIGEIMDASQEKKLWGRPQVGGSCTVRSLLSLIKSQLSKKEYLAVKEIILVENITKIYSKIKHGWGNSPLKKRVVLEGIKRLERLHFKQFSNYADYSQTLKMMKLEIIQLLKTKRKLPIEDTHSDLNFRQSLDQILLMIDHSFEIKNFIKKSSNLLDQIKNHIENKKFNLDNDDLMKISLRLLKNYSKRDLNKEQLYILIKLSLLIGKAAKNKNDQHSQYKNFLRFLHEKLIIAHGLKLGDLFKDSEFSKEIINKLKKKYNKYLFKKIPSVIEA